MRSKRASRHPETAPPCPVCEAGRTRFFQRVGDRDYRRCRTCAATFLEPVQRPDRDAERRAYDGHSNHVDDPGYRTFLSRLADRMIELLPPRSQGLDYGCGPGPALAAMLRESGHRVRLWDPIYRPDGDALQRRYDFITCSEVVEHMHRPAAHFRRFDRLLRPGGRLGIMTRFQTDDARFAGWHYRRDPTHVVFYRVRTLRHVAERLGWRIRIHRPDVALLHKPAA